MDAEIEWDVEKAESNLQKHGVSFEEAAAAFFDPLSLTVPDPLHSDEESRFVTSRTVGSSAPSGGCAFRGR